MDTTTGSGSRLHYPYDLAICCTSGIPEIGRLLIDKPRIGGDFDALEHTSAEADLGVLAGLIGALACTAAGSAADAAAEVAFTKADASGCADCGITRALGAARAAAAAAAGGAAGAAAAAAWVKAAGYLLACCAAGAAASEVGADCCAPPAAASLSCRRMQQQIERNNIACSHTGS